MTSQRDAIKPADGKLDLPKTFALPYVTGVKAGDFIFLSGLIAVDPTSPFSGVPIDDRTRRRGSEAPGERECGTPGRGDRHANRRDADRDARGGGRERLDAHPVLR